jgi:uncharacterized protein YkwD
MMDNRDLGAQRRHEGKPPRPRRAVAALTTTLLTLGLTATAPAPSGAVQVDSLALTQTATTSISSYETKVQQLVNQRRASRGLPRLRLASCPEGTSKRWSQHLADTGSFYHQSMGSVLNKCDATYAGETLGRGTMSPRKLVRMWMRSPGHRAVLMSKKPRRIGIGATKDSSGRWVVAANFVRF